MDLKTYTGHFHWKLIKYIKDASSLSMSQEDLQRYLPQQDVLNLLSDIDDYFSHKEGYAGQTQEAVTLKRREFDNRANIVTIETVRFLKDLLSATTLIATQHTKNGSPLLAPWPTIHTSIQRLMTIVWLHLVYSQFHVYGSMYFMDTRQGIERDMRLTWFDYAGYPEYPQLWGEFTHGVTILDLLFNCGNDAPTYMRYVRP